jgi:hypothetical protein
VDVDYLDYHPNPASVAFAEDTSQVIKRAAVFSYCKRFITQ